MKITSAFLLILLITSTSAREGMWMPQLLQALNESDMKSMGMEISAEDIYSVNKSSLKDAVILFGAGCTGEIISGKGLLITNHHCGFSQIQSLSSMSKNYLQDGFWAQKQEEEMPCPGLTVTFIREIIDVTELILKNVSDTLSEDRRSAIIKQRTDSIEGSVKDNLKRFIRSFYYGNKYFLFVTEVYSDIRFVGAPPVDVGKFGGETDNWVWPRHTGDFSLFRIYADKDNKAATYSKENIPYTPKRFLPININGVKENDFVFVFGFPGSTKEYLLSPALETVINQTNPNRIALREARLDVIREEMHNNDTVRLQYSSKFSTIENAYKKWKGELEGFTRTNALEKKRIHEQDMLKEFTKNSQTVLDTSIINSYDLINKEANPLNYANDYFADGFAGIELFNGTSRLDKLIDFCADTSKHEKDLTNEITKCKIDFRGFYKNYNVRTDKRICTSILNLAFKDMDKKFIPSIIITNGEKSTGGDLTGYCDRLYKKSLIADSVRLMKFLDKFSRKDTSAIKKDPGYLLWYGVMEKQGVVQNELAVYNRNLNRMQRNYMKDLLITDKSGKLYPDANLTLRVTYGRVQSVKPYDGMTYEYYTTASGIAEKNAKGIDDYKIPERLSKLIANKDFGKYAKNGILPVAFIASNHTTGGNSGSPVLNAKGELVGVNYDRMWEGVLSDYAYDEKICRNISLDIRYALFIIEKYGNAKRLIDEMTIVN